MISVIVAKYDDADAYALSIVSNNVLITVNQEYYGVYLKTFNLVTGIVSLQRLLWTVISGYNTDRQYVSETAMDLIPPLTMVELPDNQVQICFFAKDCERGHIIKLVHVNLSSTMVLKRQFRFTYVLRAGWDIDNALSTMQRQKLQMDPALKVSHQVIPTLSIASEYVFFVSFTWMGKNIQVMYVHTFDGDEYPSLIYAYNDHMYRSADFIFFFVLLMSVF